VNNLSASFFLLRASEQLISMRIPHADYAENDYYVVVFSHRITSPRVRINSNLLTKVAQTEPTLQHPNRLPFAVSRKSEPPLPVATVSKKAILDPHRWHLEDTLPRRLSWRVGF
jgi:hypothetical protein